MNEWVYKFVHILTNSCRSAHLCLDHVDSLRAQLSDAVEDVHHTFTLCHVQHNVHCDETACSSSTSTADNTEEQVYVRLLT